MESFWPYVSIAISLLAFAVAAYFYVWVQKLPTANVTIERIGAIIRQGAFAFLRREYRILTIFAGAIVVLILLFFPEPFWKGGIERNLIMAVAYVAGTMLSGLAGYVGISISTIANQKSASAARSGLDPSFMAGFRGGAVMGMAEIGRASCRERVSSVV